MICDADTAWLTSTLALGDNPSSVLTVWENVTTALRSLHYRLNFFLRRNYSFKRSKKDGTRRVEDCHARPCNTHPFHAKGNYTQQALGRVHRPSCTLSKVINNTHFKPYMHFYNTNLDFVKKEFHASKISR